jgi:histidine racemase
VRQPVDCQVFQVPGKESTYIVEAGLPLPLSWEKMMLMNRQESVAGTLVRFPGISHLIVNKTEIAYPEAFFHQVKKQLSGSQDDAFGIMFFDRSRSYIEPLVWVRATDTLFWEKGCGSGTAAIGVVLADENRKNSQQRVFQPGGSLDVSVKWQETITAISLSGEVELVAEGTAHLSLS